MALDRSLNQQLDRSMPVAPLAIIALPSAIDMGEKVSSYISAFRRLADETGKMYEDALNDAPEQVPNMDPIEKFNPDDVVKKIAERDQIPTSAVYDAIDLVYHIREYNDLHEKIYGIPGSVMLN